MHVGCQVRVEDDRIELIWFEGSAAFPPYALSGIAMIELREHCSEARQALSDVVESYLRGEVSVINNGSYRLAKAGFRLFNDLLPTADVTARKVRRWLKEVRKQSGLIGLDVVVEQASDLRAFLSVPWNLVYDEGRAKYGAFLEGQEAEHWRPFWGLRYNLTSRRFVEPLRRRPIWSDPKVVVVVDPTVHEGLNHDQKQRLDQFLAEAGLTPVGSMAGLEAALKEGYPRLLYWLGRATPEFLMLGDERIAPGDLRYLFRSFANRGRTGGTLAFLNASQTAEMGTGRSFREELYSVGFSGVIAPEGLISDTFANEFGLAFLQGFLREGKPLGELLHRLRLERVPLGLVYGAHCPPEIRVRRWAGAAEPVTPSSRSIEADTEAAPVSREVTTPQGMP
jgi:hypothetical protein